MKATRNHPFRARRAGTPCALLLSLVLTACASAPEPIGPEGIIGERARVQSPTYSKPYTGILRGLDSDTATIETEAGSWVPGSLVPIPLSPTARLEIQRGTKSNAGRGAGLGALIGGAGLAVAGAASCDGGGWFDPGPGACALGGAIVGAGAGALVGLIIGSTSESERWVEVDMARPRPDPGDEMSRDAPQ